MNDKQTVEEAFLKIRQNVIDEMFEGKRPVLKRLTEVSQNTLEIKCMQQAYQLGQSSQQGWIDVNEQLPEVGQVVLSYSSVTKKISKDQYRNFNPIGRNDFVYRDITHWMPLPNPPTPTNKDTQNS